MDLPSVPDIAAGKIVTADDLNSIADACTFLLDKPMALVYDSAGGQALGTTAPGNIISFASKYFDTDGMYSSGSPNWLTIQTEGYYKVWYSVITGSSSVASVGGAVELSAGSNNPAGLGTPIGPHWGLFGVPNSTVGARCAGSGIWPTRFYPGDKFQLWGYAAASATTSNTNPSYLGVEWVSS